MLKKEAVNSFPNLMSSFCALLNLRIASLTHSFTQKIYFIQMRNKLLFGLVWLMSTLFHRVRCENTLCLHAVPFSCACVLRPQSHCPQQSSCESSLYCISPHQTDLPCSENVSLPILSSRRIQVVEHNAVSLRC